MSFMDSGIISMSTEDNRIEVTIDKSENILKGTI